jgi:hypothetical protein
MLLDKQQPPDRTGTPDQAQRAQRKREPKLQFMVLLAGGAWVVIIAAALAVYLAFGRS